MNQLLSNDFLDSCRYAPASQNFFVDTSVNSVSILSSGGNLNLKLKDPTGFYVNPRTQSNFGGTVNVATFDTRVSGNYLLILSEADSTPCQFRVFADSGFDLFFGTSDDLRNDIGPKQPVYGGY